MKIIIDTSRCTGHGLCEAIAEDVFEVSDTEGIVELLTDTVSEDRRADMEEAVNQCPTQAISLSEEM